MFVEGVISLCGRASISGCSSDIFVGGVVNFCGWASTLGCSSEMFVGEVPTLCGFASTFGCAWPAKVDAAETADCFACLETELYVLRKRPSLPALNDIKAKRAQAMTKLRTRIDR